MEFTYDQQADVVYLYLSGSSEQTASSRVFRVHEDLLIDFDKAGFPVGVSLHNASELFNTDSIDKVIAGLKAELTEISNGSLRSFEGSDLTAEHRESVMLYVDQVLVLLE